MPAQRELLLGQHKKAETGQKNGRKKHHPNLLRQLIAVHATPEAEDKRHQEDDEVESLGGIFYSGKALADCSRHIAILPIF